MTALSAATFPISGPKENPTRDDYATEAFLLRTSHRWGQADQFERVWRRLGWAPKPRQESEAA